MSWVITDDKHYKAIADKIRQYGGGVNETSTFKPSEMAECVELAAVAQYGIGYQEGLANGHEFGYTEGFQEGYDDGFAVGEESGIAVGIEQGRQAEQTVTDAILSNVNIGHYYNDRITTLSAHAFNYHSSLLSINLPNVESTSINAISNCGSLTEAHLPKLTRGGTNALFAGCSKLEFADLGVTDAISTNTFLNCASLKVVVLRRTAGVPTLANLNAFNGTPYASGGSGGKIVLPSALIEQIKTATNWSVLYGYGTVEFVALEVSEYE